MRTNKRIKILLLLGSVICVVGCQNLGTKFGNENGNYAQAKELRPLKFPAHALSVSTRFEIPAVQGNSEAVINEITPPEN
jgi:hypothetical protein